MHYIPFPASDKSSSSALSALTGSSDFLNSRKSRCISIRRLVASGLFLIAIALLLPSAGWSQVDQGAITGTVSDSTGAVVAGAHVTLMATDTGLSFQTRSNQSGNYTFSPI